MCMYEKLMHDIYAIRTEEELVDHRYDLDRQNMECRIEYGM